MDKIDQYYSTTIKDLLGIGINKGNFFGTRQWIEISSGHSFDKGGVWSRYIEPIIKSNFFYYDHAFQLDIPFSTKELKKFSGLNRPLFAEMKSEYNFLIKDYENVLKRQQKK